MDSPLLVIDRRAPSTLQRAVGSFTASLIARGVGASDIQNALLSYATGPEMNRLMSPAAHAFEEQDDQAGEQLAFGHMEEWERAVHDAMQEGEMQGDLSLLHILNGLLDEEQSLPSHTQSSTLAAFCLQHQCHFEGTHRSELCNQSMCMREFYRSKKDPIFQSRCGQPILIAHEMEGSPLFIVEIVNPDGSPLQGQGADSKLMLKCDNAEDAKLEISPNRLGNLRIIGHSSKRGDISLCPKISLKITAVICGLSQGSLLSNPFVVTSSQSDHPKSFCDAIEEHQPAKRLRGIGVGSEWAKKTVAELRSYLSNGGRLTDQRSHLLAEAHLNYWLHTTQ
jgi:hypothetical protein